MKTKELKKIVFIFKSLNYNFQITKCRRIKLPIGPVTQLDDADSTERTIRRRIQTRSLIRNTEAKRHATKRDNKATKPMNRT